MNVTNCKGCGRLFNVMGNSRLCPQCINNLEEKFQQVKKYLNENPNSSIDQVSTENDVSVKQIKQWVREERLTFAEGSVGGVDCEVCGTMIRTGRYCDACRVKMANTFAGAIDKPRVSEPKKQERDKDRMRFLQS